MTMCKAQLQMQPTYARACTACIDVHAAMLTLLVKPVILFAADSMT